MSRIIDWCWRYRRHAGVIAVGELLMTVALAWGYSLSNGDGEWMFWKAAQWFCVIDIFVVGYALVNVAILAHKNI